MMEDTPTLELSWVLVGFPQERPILNSCGLKNPKRPIYISKTQANQKCKEKGAAPNAAQALGHPTRPAPNPSGLYKNLEGPSGSVTPKGLFSSLHIPP